MNPATFTVLTGGSVDPCWKDEGSRRVGRFIDRQFSKNGYVKFFN